jgi:hypothetical protein
LKAELTRLYVPKSEYDAVVSAVDNSTKEFLNLHDAYQNAKAETEKWKAEAEECYSDTAIMREYTINQIFEEIEKSVYSKIPMKIRPIFKDDRDFDAGVIDGKRDALIEVLALIVELKKKYTEENT